MSDGSIVQKLLRLASPLHPLKYARALISNTVAVFFVIEEPGGADVLIATCNDFV